MQAPDQMQKVKRPPAVFVLPILRGSPSESLSRQMESVKEGGPDLLPGDHDGIMVGRVGWHLDVIAPAYETRSLNQGELVGREEKAGKQSLLHLLRKGGEFHPELAAAAPSNTGSGNHHRRMPIRQMKRDRHFESGMNRSAPLDPQSLVG